MSTPISAFCKDRFEPLNRYCQGVTVSDWATLDATEVASTMPDELKMLAAVLHRKLEREGLFREPVSNPFGGNPLKTLQWCQAVTSKLFPSHRTLESTVHKTPDAMLSGLGMIDLRYNNLMDDDMTDVLVLCDRAASAGSTSFVLDLSGNRLSPNALDDISKLCSSRAEVAFVFLPDVGHVGAKDKLSELANELFFKKLIFIRAMHMVGEQWHEVVPPVWWNVVEKTHDTFYTQFPAFKELRSA